MKEKPPRDYLALLNREDSLESDQQPQLGPFNWCTITSADRVFPFNGTVNNESYQKTIIWPTSKCISLERLLLLLLLLRQVQLVFYNTRPLKGMRLVVVQKETVKKRKAKEMKTTKVDE